MTAEFLRLSKGQRFGGCPLFIWFRLPPVSIPKIFRRLGLWLGIAAFLGLLCSGIFYKVTLTALASFLTLSQPPERSDLILVLGGDFFGPRVIAGAELGAQGYSSRVMISGPPYHGRPESDLAVDFLAKKGYRPEMFISVPIQARSTIGEALAVCPELRRLGARRVLIVTSAYHSRRANIVFRVFCPGIRFRSVAAPDSQFAVANWWTNPRYREVFFSEWEKILASVFWKYPQYLWDRLRGESPHVERE